MAVVFSLINMKGGVGKTTLATQLAWFATYTRNKRVLLVDLDPQANASHAIMGLNKYVEWLNEERLTISNVFEEFTPTGRATSAPTPLVPEDVIYRRIEYADGSLLDLVPSRLELSWTLRNAAGKESLLARFIAKVEQNYDVIIIDCAPTDSMLTDAAYLASRYLLVPLKAEFLASIGFPLLSRSLSGFRLRHEDHRLDVAGLVFNDYRDNRESRLAIKDVKGKAVEYKWHIFSKRVHHSDSYPRSARDGMFIHQTKGTHTKTKDAFTAFASEFFDRIGVK